VAARWTETELEVLNDMVGILNYCQLSKKLKRSRSAIELKRCRDKMPTFFDNIITQSLLAQELGRSRASIRKYYRKGWLKGKQATWSCAWGKKPIIFLEDDIVQFLKDSHHLFDWKKMPNIYYRNVVKEASR
jgi:hypothetical protein